MTLHFLRGQPGFMATRGIISHVVTSPGADLDLFLSAEPGVTGHVVPMTRRITPGHDLLALARMVLLIRRLRPDIVHTHTPKGGLVGVLAARIAGVPLVVHHLHGAVWLTASGIRGQLARWGDWLTCQLAHRVFSVSQSIRNAVIQECLCQPEKVEVLANGSINGIDTIDRFNPERHVRAGKKTRSHFGIPDDALVVGFIGRLTAEKGIGELGDAWRLLREEVSNVHLLLVGPSDDVLPFSAAVRSMFLADERVHFAGMDFNTPPLYAAMDLFVLPTYREGFPVVLLEAQAMKVPVVATLVPGCVDAVKSGVTGLLVPAMDKAALLEAIRVYLMSPERRGRDGEAARRHVAAMYKPVAIWRELLQCYQSILTNVDNRTHQPTS